MHLSVGKLDLEAGGMRHRVGPFWVPCDLHVWWGDRGVHLYLFPPAVERDTAP